MNKPDASPNRDGGWSRPAWIVYASICALLLMIHLWRWTQRHTGLDSALAPTGFLIMALAQVFRLQGTALMISQLVCGLVLILATIMLLR